MKLTPLFLALLLNSCAARIARVTVVKDTPTHSIGQLEDGSFLVWAISPAEANRAIDAECKHKDRVCSVNSDGVVYRYTVASDDKLPERP